MEIKPYQTEFMQKDEKVEGRVIKITTEPVYEARFKNALTTIAELERGKQSYFTFNQSTQKNCRNKWGGDTKNWINKKLISLGTVDIRTPRGIVKGIVWEPVPSEPVPEEPEE